MIRASKLSRNVLNSKGAKVPLNQAVLHAIELGTFTMDLRGTPRHAAKTAVLSVSICEVVMPSPRHKSTWLVGISSILAIRLFELKYLGRNQPEARASTHVPSARLRCLKLMRPKVKLTELTVYDFFRQLAMLGGFLGRKHDGEPGWQTVWRGYQKMQQTLLGIELVEDSS